MAVLASATATLSSVVDVAAVYRYYLLQSSTLAVPAKPTANPPGGSWDDVEPPYTSGSTNSLYTVELTVFSDGTWSYSEVSLSSSYEAAKGAYNKAAAAADAAQEAQETANKAEEAITAKSTQITAMQGQIAALITEDTNIKGDYDALVSRYNTIEATVGTLSATIGEHTTLIDENSGAILAVQTQANTIESDLAGTKQTVLAVQTDLTDTKTQMATYETTLDGLVVSLETVSKTVDGNTEMLSAHEARILAAEGEVSLKVTQTDIDTAISGIEIGGRNLLLGSATKKLSAYSGAQASFETGVAVAEWGAEDATRAYGTGGTSTVIATLEGVSASPATAIDGVGYIHSIYVKNNGTGTLYISGSLGEEKAVQPGEATRVAIPGTGDGLSALQFEFSTPAAGDAFDFVYWHPQIEVGTVVTDWTPAPEDIESEITVVETIATQTATQMSWLVKSGTSATDFTLTDRAATLVANTINLTGLVAFSGLDSAAQEQVINAQQTADSAITAVTAWSYGDDITYIDGGKIYAGSIKASQIDVDDLYAFNATIGGFTVGTDAIYSIADMFGAAESNIYIGSAGISLGTTFQVAMDGAMAATKGEIADWHIYGNMLSNYASPLTYDEWSQSGDAITWVGMSATGGVLGYLWAAQNEAAGGLGLFYVDNDCKLHSSEAEIYNLGANCLTLPNGKYIQWEDTSGAAVNLMTMNASNIFCVGNSARAMCLFGSSIILPNNIYLRWRDKDGTAANLIRMDSGNNFYLGATAYATYIQGSKIYLGNNAYFGTSGVYMVDTSGNASIRSLELRDATPYIDFHFGESTADYTSRIIEAASGQLNLVAPSGVCLNGVRSYNTYSVAKSCTVAVSTAALGGYGYTDVAWTIPSGSVLIGVSWVITSGSMDWGAQKTVHLQSISATGCRCIVASSVAGTVDVTLYVFYRTPM